MHGQSRIQAKKFAITFSFFAQDLLESYQPSAGERVRCECKSLMTEVERRK